MSELCNTRSHIVGSWNDNHDEWTTKDGELSIVRTNKWEVSSHGEWTVVKHPGGPVYANESYLECRKKVAELVFGKPVSSLSERRSDD